MSTTHRAVIYARLSQDRAGTGAGVDRQLTDARAVAKMRDLQVVAEYTDNDTSAAGGKVRPGFEAALRALQDGQADTLIAWAWDRLSRNRRDTLRLIEVGQEHKTTVALVKGSDVDMSSASGRLVADLLAGVARAEIDSKSERQVRAARQQAEQGAVPSRRAFGYQQNGKPDPVEAPVVVEVFALFLAGATQTGLAKKLNGEGHTTTRGKQWHDTTIRVMLSNPRYAGERRYLGELVATGQWDPLVTAETFAAVKAKLDDPSRKKRRAARRHLGGSLFRCHCGATVKVSYSADASRVYVCGARRHMQRKADEVDQVVLGVVAERLRRADLSSLTAVANKGIDVAALRAQAIGLRARQDDLGREFADGNLTGRQVGAATERIAVQLVEIEAQLAEAGKTSVVASIAGAADLGNAWLALPLDRQRAVLDAIAKVIILPGRRGRGSFDPESVQIDWKTAS